MSKGSVRRDEATPGLWASGFDNLDWHNDKPAPIYLTLKKLGAEVGPHFFEEIERGRTSIAAARRDAEDMKRLVCTGQCTAAHQTRLEAIERGCAIIDANGPWRIINDPEGWIAWSRNSSHNYNGATLADLLVAIAEQTT